MPPPTAWRLGGSPAEAFARRPSGGLAVGSTLTRTGRDLVIVLNACLSAALGARAMVSVQHPVRLGDRTEPQPDLAVLKLDRRRGVPLAADALLVIEVDLTDLCAGQALDDPSRSSRRSTK